MSALSERRSPAGFLMWTENELEKYRCDSALEKEPETAAWISEFFEPGQTFFDIGANIGVFTLLAAQLHPEVRVFAFEPFLPNFNHLEMNIRLNQFANAWPFHLAFSKRNGIVMLNAWDERTGGSGSQVGRCVKETGESFEPVAVMPVCVYRLDSFVETFGVPDPDHLKIDVDGLEANIVDGLHDVLRRERLKSVMIEANTASVECEQMFARFADAGFTRDNHINARPDHSRERRRGTPSEQAENILFTRT